MKKVIFFLLFLPGILYSKDFKAYKNISYSDPSTESKKTLLDIYAPNDRTVPKEVFVFIHGGSWVSGKKNHYVFLGKRLAAKGIVAVIINYPLAQDASITQMEMSCARALDWCYQHIGEYGGNKNKIFVSGHSAGGQLAAMLSVNERLFDSLQVENPVKGCILIDAFGLDMFSYLGHMTYNPSGLFFKIFSGNSQIWKAHSPLYQIENKTPFLIFFGDKTYPAIKSSSRDFNEKLKKSGIESKIIAMKKKGHIRMILQLYSRRNGMYEEILAFIRKC
jgi:acetyl esterase/lipase